MIVLALETIPRSITLPKKPNPPPPVAFRELLSLAGLGELRPQLLREVVVDVVVVPVVLRFRFTERERERR